MTISLMVADRHVAKFVTIRTALSLPLTPLQYLVSYPIQLFERIKTLAITQDNLIKENLQLRSDKLLLQSRLQRLIAIESENIYLKALLQSATKVKGKTLIAELLAVNSEPFINQVLLDKGTKDGVYAGQPVLDASGVLGQVTQVGPLTSRVLLISDPHSGVAVQNARNGMRALASGDGYAGQLRLLYIPKTADIQVNDIYLTSGLGDRYPEGYPVGKVMKVIKDPSHQFATVYLQPAAHLESSRQVLLVWYQHHA